MIWSALLNITLAATVIWCGYQITKMVVRDGFLPKPPWLDEEEDELS